jgi:diguanylate cyclase (GGDEF)-like protein
MSKKTVLIVDDSLLLHKLIRTYLEPDELTIYSAHDGEAGLTIAQDLRPDLILLDVDMPRVDGFEVCRRLKANPRTAKIPVLFLTAWGVLDNKIRGLDLGAADYISKPFKPNELRARVRATLRAKNQLEAASLVDAPSGLWNRTYLEGHLDLHVSLAIRLDTPLSCIIIDLDWNHGATERLGNAAASEMMRFVARILVSRCRTEDVICRFDKWKFAILVIGANRADAAILAGRYCAEIRRQLRARNSRETPINFRYGVADTRGANSGTLLYRANAVLQDAPDSEVPQVRIPIETTALLHAVA